MNEDCDKADEASQAAFDRYQADQNFGILNSDITTGEELIRANELLIIAMVRYKE